MRLPIVELLPEALGRFGQVRDDFEPLVQILDRLLVRGPLYRLARRPIEIVDGLGPLLAGERMVRETLHVLVEAIRVERLA